MAGDNHSVGSDRLKVSVAVPVRNGGTLFRRCLEGVLEQRLDAEWEVVVADTESTDGSREWVESLAREGAPLRWFSVSPEEFGHGRTRNELVRFARGEIVAFLTQDAVPGTSSWLRELVDALDTFPEAAGVFGRHEAWPEHGAVMRRNTAAHFRQFGSEAGCVFASSPEAPEDAKARRQFLRFYSDNNSALRRSVWERIPYPDVEFGEDQLWAEQVLQAGYGKAYAPDAWVYHSHRYPFFEAIRRARIEGEYYAAVFEDPVGVPLRRCLRDAWRTARSEWRFLAGEGNDSVGERLRTARDIFALHIGHHLCWRRRWSGKETIRGS